MTKRYSVARARAELPAIIDAVQAGSAIEIARRGELVAVVISPEAWASNRTSFSDAYDRFVDSHLSKQGIDKKFIHGLRDRSPARKVRAL